MQTYLTCKNFNIHKHDCCWFSNISVPNIIHYKGSYTGITTFYRGWTCHYKAINCNFSSCIEEIISLDLTTIATRSKFMTLWHFSYHVKGHVLSTFVMPITAIFGLNDVDPIPDPQAPASMHPMPSIPIPRLIAWEGGGGAPDKRAHA